MIPPPTITTRARSGIGDAGKTRATSRSRLAKRSGVVIAPKSVTGGLPSRLVNGVSPDSRWSEVKRQAAPTDRGAALGHEQIDLVAMDPTRRRLPGLRPSDWSRHPARRSRPRDPHLRVRGRGKRGRQQDARDPLRGLPRHVLGPPGVEHDYMNVLTLGARVLAPSVPSIARRVPGCHVQRRPAQPRAADRSPRSRPPG